MRKRATTIMIHASGWILIVLGVLAGLVPLVPGIILIIIGFYILSHRSAFLKRHLDNVRGKHSGVNEVISRFESWLGSAWQTIRSRFYKIRRYI